MASPVKESWDTIRSFMSLKEKNKKTLIISFLGCTVGMYVYPVVSL